ncbi:MAG: DUF3489 domain-containing protein [Pseudomonadota bacterium]|nr:DUF3489 domain-containing protein [Pseudomonadota bacterium]MDE3037098.1 DUF3489 domain-containing protein [Pseudomonadota bacterium]
MSKLSPTQRRILEAASLQPGVDVREHMQDIKSPPIRDKVVESMLKHGLIAENQEGEELAYIITDAGIAAVGGTAPDDASGDADPAEEGAEPKRQRAAKADKPPRVTKNGLLLDMLKEGTTIHKIMEATGWQKHSVFGTVSNLKKKLRLTIASEKAEGEERVYKIA